MRQEERVKDEAVIPDTEKAYSGMEDPEKEERTVRKALGLPAKKQLVFYKEKRNAESAVNVREYRILKTHSAAELWYTVEVTLEDGSRIRIHSDHFAEMQKPGFAEDMAAQMI